MNVAYIETSLLADLFQSKLRIKFYKLGISENHFAWTVSCVPLAGAVIPENPMILFWYITCNCF